MRILIIRNYPSYMAVKNNTYNIQEVGLAKALVRKGHICDIVFWTDKQEEDVVISVDAERQVNVFYRYGKTMLKNTVYTRCNELFSQYDILQPAEYNQIQAWLLAKKQPQKTVIYHGPYYSKFNKRYNMMCKVFDAVFLKKYIQQNTQFLVKSELAKQFLIHKGIRAENICTVGVGIDTQMLSNNEVECCEPLYQKMKSDSNELKLLYIGRFEKRRNIPFIIDIFQKVLEKCSNARLYMVGSGEKEYLEAAFDYMDKTGVRDKVFWQEKMEQKYLSNIYRLADFFLLPTEYEIFGMVLLEAMYYGTVVLTTNNGGSSTLIDNSINGFILEDSDAGKWSDIIEDVYSDKEKMLSIQKSATEKIANEFIWDEVAQKIIEVYEIKCRRK